MKIRTPDRTAKPKRPIPDTGPAWSVNSDQDDVPLPVRKPDVRTRTQRQAEGTVTPMAPSHDAKGLESDQDRRQRQSAAMKRYWAKRKAEGRGGFQPTKGKSRLSTKWNAKPHSIWIRKDIWSAIEVHASRTDRTMRSIVEEAVYHFLIREGRVADAKDLGEAYGQASWIQKEEE